MSLSAILTYFDGDDRSTDRLRAAIGISRQLDAHLTAVAYGYDPNMPAYAYGEASAALMANMAVQAKTAATERAEQADGIVRQAGIKGEVIPRVATYGGLARDFGDLAQFADLVILSQSYGEGIEEMAARALEGALFDGIAATLSCPAEIDSLDLAQVVIAWDGGREAMRAVRRALPLLEQAKAVEILMICPPANQPDPGQTLATFLARHRVNVEIYIQPPTTGKVSDILRTRVTETGAGLLVMGAYGHSRFREYMLGGATRDILSDLPVPVLMAH